MDEHSAEKQLGKLVQAFSPAFAIMAITVDMPDVRQAQPAQRLMEFLRDADQTILSPARQVQQPQRGAGLPLAVTSWWLRGYWAPLRNRQPMKTIPGGRVRNSMPGPRPSTARQSPALRLPARSGSCGRLPGSGSRAGRVRSWQNLRHAQPRICVLQKPAGHPAARGHWA